MIFTKLTATSLAILASLLVSSVSATHVKGSILIQTYPVENNPHLEILPDKTSTDWIQFRQTDAGQFVLDYAHGHERGSANWLAGVGEFIYAEKKPETAPGEIPSEGVPPEGDSYNRVYCHLEGKLQLDVDTEVVRWTFADPKDEDREVCKEEQHGVKLKCNGNVYCRPS